MKAKKFDLSTLKKVDFIYYLFIGSTICLIAAGGLFIFNQDYIGKAKAQSTSCSSSSPTPPPGSGCYQTTWTATELTGWAVAYSAAHNTIGFDVTTVPLNSLSSGFEGLWVAPYSNLYEEGKGSYNGSLANVDWGLLRADEQTGGSGVYANYYNAPTPIATGWKVVGQIY